MASIKNTSAVTFRLDNSDLDKLDEICRIFRCKRSEFIVNCIRGEFDKLQGSPEVRAIMEQLQNLSVTIDNFGK